MTILLTGAAGFIGARTAALLLARGETVVGVDNLNDYYDPGLKQARLDRLKGEAGFTFLRADIADPGLAERVSELGIDRIIHLAAQAGVRYSIEAPRAYAASNLTGHTEMLEMARRFGVKHMVYASSSSVYGRNTDQPFREDQVTDTPVSFYGATKKANELMSESYASLYSIPLTGLRFFTVYGPMGRPDMAYMLFADAMMAGEPIKVFGEGQMARDFTYIDDIAEGVIAALDHPPKGAPPHRVYNLGNDRPEELSELIELLEEVLGRKAERQHLPMQQGDVRRTWASIDRAREELGYAPKTGLREGLAAFAAWYKEYRKTAWC
ncbi:NAD-dependent epimerase/dehydratase family protein [Parvularcula maris]|uniref:NAD-dependent epimerase/dehydratase family protein n=1 Tax=Parvularcula maris TaxID=2965077 RepID=A0A9X2L8R5_9PROT|nr:NAD-dependent epimerase/dehydratase family protein [Parvularcula maris]MCQ8185180.1 NAD-dependent epimerase/dehydratase family protein [Parvularcula maris]